MRPHRGPVSPPAPSPDRSRRLPRLAARTRSAVVVILLFGVARCIAGPVFRVLTLVRCKKGGQEIREDRHFIGDLAVDHDAGRLLTGQQGDLRAVRLWRLDRPDRHGKAHGLCGGRHGAQRHPGQPEDGGCAGDLQQRVKVLQQHGGVDESGRLAEQQQVIVIHDRRLLDHDHDRVWLRHEDGKCVRRNGFSQDRRQRGLRIRDGQRTIADQGRRQMDFRAGRCDRPRYGVGRGICYVRVKTLEGKGGRDLDIRRLDGGWSRPRHERI